MAPSPLFRGVALQFSETASLPPLGEAYAFEVYTSESLLAALRTSTAFAARRASVLCVACSPANASELLAGEERCVPSASAAADHAASTTAPSPSGSHLFALYATEWVHGSLAISSAASTARGEHRDFILPPTTAATQKENRFFQSLMTALSGYFTAADARAAAMMFPFGPLMFSLPSTTSAPTSSTHGSDIPELDVHHLINVMNNTELNFVEEIMFRKAFNVKHQNFRIADVSDYLENHTYTFEEMRYILKVLYRKIGHHRDLMEFMIKEDMLHGCSSEEELNENPVTARIEVKLDGAIKMLDKHSVELHNISELVHNQKPDWGSRKIFGRKLDFTRVIEFFWWIFRG